MKTEIIAVETYHSYSQILKNNSGELFILSNSSSYKSFYLYEVSDEELNVGDW